MKKTTVMKQLFYILFFAALTGCGTAKLVISDDLKAAHDEYAVKGKDGILIKQKLSFGEFRTTHVRRSWTTGYSGRTGFGTGSPYRHDYTNIISTEYINRKQTVKFSLADGSQASDVYCVSRFNSQDLVVGKNESSIFNIALDLFGNGYCSNSTYYVQIYTNANDRPWQLLIDNERAQTRSRSYIGYLANGQGSFYTIHPATRMIVNGKEGETLAGAVGFEIRDARGVTVAAMSSLNRGTVFLGRRTAEERFLLANVCAALLLQQQIEE